MNSGFDIGSGAVEATEASSEAGCSGIGERFVEGREVEGAVFLFPGKAGEIAGECWEKEVLVDSRLDGVPALFDRPDDSPVEEELTEADEAFVTLGKMLSFCKLDAADLGKGEGSDD